MLANSAVLSGRGVHALPRPLGGQPGGDGVGGDVELGVTGAHPRLGGHVGEEIHRSGRPVTRFGQMCAGGGIEPVETPPALE